MSKRKTWNEYFMEITDLVASRSTCDRAMVGCLLVNDDNRIVSSGYNGSGITRFKDYNINEQELLELIIWSFKISRVKFTYPSRVSIILHESARDKVNLYRLKGGEV